MAPYGGTAVLEWIRIKHIDSYSTNWFHMISDNEKCSMWTNYLERKAISVCSRAVSMTIDVEPFQVHIDKLFHLDSICIISLVITIV